MYDTEEYIETILDIGTSIISSGAETHCVEDSLFRNFLLAFAVEMVILGSYRIGLAHHPDYITITAIMFLIGTLGLTNGLDDFVHLDTIQIERVRKNVPPLLNETRFICDNISVSESCGSC